MNKEKRFLVTTALEESWVTDQPTLFLGEWCRLYSRKDRWSKMNVALLPYHWADRDKLYSDYQYLNSLYECILVDLSSRLNQIHNVGHNLRYWRILIGPWLAYFIQILFDRWLSIQSAVDSFEISGTIVLTGNDDKLIPNDMNHFTELMVGDGWNHHIYAEILNRQRNVRIIKRNSRQGCSSSETDKAKTSINKKVLHIYSGIAKYFIRDHDVFIISTYLTKLTETRLQLKFGQVPQFWKNIDPVQMHLDWEKRNWVMPVHGQSDFEYFLLSMIPKQIPIVYLEGYQHLVEQFHKLPWPKSPKLIYTASVLWHDSVSMAYTAEKVAQGTPLVYGQHGGVYGVAKFSFAEEHENKISDRYLTWGWVNESDTYVVPVGIGKIGNRLGGCFNLKKKIVIITLNSSRYTYRLCSESAIDFTNYIENYFSFTSLLNDYIKTNILIRLSSWDRGWEQSLRWGDRFPGIELDLGCRRIYDLMKESRLVVLTYNQTAMLETLALGIPSVLFCDLNVTPLRDAAIPYYAQLKRVGIFHDTPESAAAHVNAIWDDVDAWWKSVEVQKVRLSFTKQYCNQSDDILNGVEYVLRDVIAASERKKL